MDTTVIATDAITQVEGRNPRKELGDLTELAASLKLHGMLQPLVVEQTDNGDVVLVTGHRRLAAARKLGWSTVPVYATAADPNAAALVENIQRLNLTPIEEAEAFARLKDTGMKAPAIAKAMSVSKDNVADRLKLLSLDERIQAGIGDGTIPLGAVPALVKITDVADADAAAQFAGYVVKTEELEWADVIRDTGNAFEEAIQDAPETSALWRIYNARPWSTVNLAEIGIEDPDVLARVAAVNGYVAFAEEDVDAARAYGCLLEFDQVRFANYQFVTDVNWLRDRALVMLERKEASERDYGNTRVDKATEDPEDRKARLATARANRDAAQLANVNLGVTLQKELHTATLTLERAKLLALIILKHHGTEIGFALSWVLEDSEFEVDVQRKDGTTATKRIKNPRMMAEKFEGEIMLCTKPNQVLGLLMQGLMAMVLADPEAAPQSQRVPGPWQLTSDAAFLDFVAKDVPESISERLTARFSDTLKKYGGSDDA